MQFCVSYKNFKKFIKTLSGSLKNLVLYSEGAFNWFLHIIKNSYIDFAYCGMVKLKRRDAKGAVADGSYFISEQEF